jgi:hypothetical protein
MRLKIFLFLFAILGAVPFQAVVPAAALTFLLQVKQRKELSNLKININFAKMG